ncbi:MAG: hypothetical protein IJV54_13565 [Bacteroidales bacterium]|nr:hypothetical protein [Bacteroidales bacterium]
MEYKKIIFDILRKKGAFWSHEFPEGVLPDDEIIMEKGLLYLEFEDIPMLFKLYGRKRLMDFWRDRLVSQGEYYNVINWLLAVEFFHIKNPDQYLKKHAKGVIN